MLINTIWGVMDLEEYRKFMNLTDEEYKRAKQKAKQDLEEAKLRAWYKELDDVLYTYRIFYPDGKPGINFNELKTCEDYEKAVKKVRDLISDWYEKQEEREKNRNRNMNQERSEYSSLGYNPYKAQSIEESKRNLGESYTSWKREYDHMCDRW